MRTSDVSRKSAINQKEGGVKNMGSGRWDEAFELWYLMHFNYHDTGISRDDYKAKLKPHFRYSKADCKIYQKLESRQTTAMGNARRLERQRLGEKNPERQNPSTSVHKLVEILNELKGLGSAT